MKSLKIIVVLIGITCFSVQHIDAQQKKITPVVLNEANVKSLPVTQLPEKVQKSASVYAGYEVKKAFVSQQKNNKKIYKVIVARGPIEYTLFIDEKGKVLEMTE
jgi:hypothetical protein